MLRKLLLSLALLACTVLTVRADAEAQKAIQEIAADLEADKDVKSKVEAFKKKYDELHDVMHSYKPKSKKGIGVGADGTGIEAKINALGSKGITKAAFDKEKADLLKMAYINLAIGHITDKYTPDKNKAKWTEYNDDMKKQTLELVKAIKAGDVSKIKSTSGNVGNACNNCHTDFR